MITSNNCELASPISGLCYCARPVLFRTLPGTFTISHHHLELLPARNSSPKVVVASSSPSWGSLLCWGKLWLSKLLGSKLLLGDKLLLGNKLLLLNRSGKLLRSSVGPDNSKSKRADLRFDMNIGLSLDLLMDVGLSCNLFVHVRHYLGQGVSSADKSCEDLEKKPIKEQKKCEIPKESIVAKNVANDNITHDGVHDDGVAGTDAVHSTPACFIPAAVNVRE